MRCSAASSLADHTSSWSLEIGVESLKINVPFTVGVDLVLLDMGPITELLKAGSRLSTEGLHTRCKLSGIPSGTSDDVSC